MLLDCLTNYKNSQLQACVEILLRNSHFPPIARFDGCSRGPVVEAWMPSTLHHFLMTMKLKESCVQSESLPFLRLHIMKKPHESFSYSDVCHKFYVHLYTINVSIMINRHKFWFLIGITHVNWHLSNPTIILLIPQKAADFVRAIKSMEVPREA